MDFSKLPDYRDGTNSGLSDFTKFLIANFSLPRENVLYELLPGGENLLDLGSGYGEFCNLATDKYKHVYGIDYSQERTEYATAHYKDVTFYEEDLNNMPLDFSNNYFDAITSLVTLDWVYDLNSLLSEVYRILKPNGLFVFEVSNLGFILRRFQLLFGKYPKVSSISEKEWKRLGWDYSVCHLFTKKVLVDFLKEFNFSPIKITGNGIFRSLRTWYPSLLCGDLIFVCRKL